MIWVRSHAEHTLVPTRRDQAFSVLVARFAVFSLANLAARSSPGGSARCSGGDSDLTGRDSKKTVKVGHCSLTDQMV